jgi:CheY-like chemotaxis protein
MSRPRVLVVDDDAAIRRLVALTLEDLPVELCLCASVAQARAELLAAPVQLVITDLMMPGTSGFELLAELAAHPRWRAGARLVAFSAGLDAAARERLAGCDVWRMLSKPVSVAALEACVREAVLGSAAGASRLAEAAEREGVAMDEAQAIERHFAGDAALFKAFKAACRQQFGADLAAGDAGLAAADAPALRRLGHSLKGVLQSLGHQAAAVDAQVLERAALSGNWDEAQQAWRLLRVELQRLAG